jgi:hypothetical protein
MIPVSKGIVVAIEACEPFGKALLQSRFVVAVRTSLLEVDIP